MNVPIQHLVKRGDGVSVVKGQLVIAPDSHKPVPPDWLADNERRLIMEAACLRGMLALEYIDYSVGNYSVDAQGTKLAGGVSLQFRCLQTGEDWYAIFNAETTRLRTTKAGKAGEPLPKGHFRVRPKSAFVRLWKSTGLPIRRLSDFHDYMGNLAGITFTGKPKEQERLVANTVTALSITPEELRTLASQPDMRPTAPRQTTDNAPTTSPDKETRQPPNLCGIAPITTAGANHYGNTVTRESGNTGNANPSPTDSIDDWLADYEKAGG